MNACFHLGSVTCDNCRPMREGTGGQVICPRITVTPVFIPHVQDAEIDRLARAAVGTPIRCDQSGCEGIWWQGQRERSRLCPHLAEQFTRAAADFIANGPGGP